MENIDNQREKKKRNISNYKIVVRISYNKDIRGEEIKKEDDLGIRYQESLEEAFNKYSNINNKNKQKYFFLEQGKKRIELEKDKKIETLNLKSGDRIFISTEKIENNVKKYIRDKTENIEMYNMHSKKLKKILALIIPISSVILIAIIGLLLFFFYFRKKDKKNFEEENLVTKINYAPKTIYRYKSNKITNMKVDASNISESDTSQNITQYTDFMLIVKDKYEEIINDTYKKNWFDGFIAISNITLNNGTDDMMIFYDSELDNLLKNSNNNKRSLNQNEDIDLKYIDENDTSCFVKIEFYENGEIKNIFLPNIFSPSNMVYINNIIKLIIPKISS